MAVCARCGEDNPDRARFCLACGSPLAEEQPTLETRKTVTVLFCDVTGSTSLGERQDPEQVRRVMSRYYERARGVLEHHGGTVEKFIGDAVMAVFGIPVLHEDDALRALRAAVDLREAIGELNGELDRQFGVSLAVRIGVNSGEVVAGDPTGGQAFVAGDSVNVAQRLEAAAEPGEILIGGATYWLARDAIRSESLGTLTVKGKEDPVPAHRLLAIVAGASSHARRFDSPMVGRERELALLEDAFERAVRERSCHLFTVLGSAGVGKSRLVREALRDVGDRARVLSGACLPYGEGITFWPALEVVKQGVGIADEDSPAEALTKIEDALAGEEWARLAAERVAALVGVEEHAAAAEEGFWGFRKLLEAMARRQPLVVCFDDANWAEPTLLDLVDHVADWTRDAPILLVCLARPDLLDVRPSWGGGKRNATTIFLEPLSEDESGTLLSNLLGGTGVAGDVLDRIHPSAEGNPLFVEEMVSMLIDGGVLRREEDHWTLGGDVSEIRVPDSIQLLLASRLDQLGEGERRVIERGAVEGSVFHRGAIEALADDVLHGRVDEYLQLLVRKELIRPHRASFAGEDAFRFRHVLIREAAYDALPKQVRAELHEGFAAWLEGVAGDRIAEVEELLGYHLEQAYRYRLQLARVDEPTGALGARAGQRLGAAGRRALARGDASSAANLLDRAIRLLPVEAPERLGLLLDRAEALREVGEFSTARDTLDDALVRAVAARERGLEARARLELACLLPFVDPEAATTEEILRAAEHAAEVFEALGDDAGQARAHRRIADVHWLGCRVATGQPALERALEHARRAGDERELSVIRYALIRAAAFGPMPADDAVLRCEQILEDAAGDLLTDAVAANALAYLEGIRGRFDEARALAARSRAILEELGLTLMIATLDSWTGQIEMLAGDPAAAEQLWRAAYRTLEGFGEKGNLSTIAAFLAEALHDQDRDDEAERLTEVSERAAFRDDVTTQIAWRATRAKIRAGLGHLEEAESLAREAVKRAAETDWPSIRGGALLALAEVLSVADRDGEAEPFIDEAVAVFEAKGNVSGAGRARVFLEERALSREASPGDRAS